MTIIAKNGQISHTRFSEEYESLVHRFQQFLSRNGINVRAFSEGGLAHFLRFGLADQERFTNQLRSYLAICVAAEKSGIDVLNDTSYMVRFTANMLKIGVPEDFISTITSQDIVEIFNYEGTQLYRNLHFFEISDYTLDDFFGHHWIELYERAQSVTQKLIERVEYATQQKKCVPFGIEEHYMREMATKNRKIVKVRLKYVAPLLRGGRPVAWIASSEAEIVAPTTSVEAEKLLFFRPGSA
jgi:hypothetical protein